MLERVQDARVWRNIKLLYIGSGLLFGANITVGIVNVFTDAPIPHAQILTHFHAGSIGWVTLSTIATMLWLFTGTREVSQGYGRFTGWLAALGFLSVLGYIFAFALAFDSDGGDLWYLLPSFGIPTALVILTAFVFAALQLKRQTLVTTAHLLLFGALLIASLGATMGVILGLTYTLDDFSPYGDNEAADGIGSHAGPMDMYISLAFAAMLELLLLRGVASTRWSKAGMAQMVLAVVAALAISVGLFIGIEPLAPVALLLFLASFGVYFGRIGWRTFTQNPGRPGANAGVFFGGLFFPAYVGLFVFLVFQYFIPGDDPPHELLVLFQHVTFVGVGTNAILTMQSRFTVDAGTDKLFAASVWLLNIGLAAFVAGEFLAEMKHGALLMAVGVILGVATVWSRFVRAEAPEQLEPTPIVIVDDGFDDQDDED